MKKVFKIAAALAVMASAFFFGSCGDDEIVNVLAGPKNTWCKMPVQYKTSDDENASTANLYAHFYYTDTDKTISGVPFPAGLSIVVTAFDDSASEIIQGLSDTAYIMKSFPKDVETTVASDVEGEPAIKVNGSVAKWSAIYWAKDDLHNKENQTTTAPSQLSGTNLGENGIANFSWKRLLANYLLNILEE